MSVIGNFLSAVAQILDLVLTLYMYIIIAAALVSWVNPDPYNPIIRFLRTATEPVLIRIRRAIGGVYSGIDFSPLVVILAILFLRMFLVGTLKQMAAGM